MMLRWRTLRRFDRCHYVTCLLIGSCLLLLFLRHIRTGGDDYDSLTAVRNIEDFRMLGAGTPIKLGGAADEAARREYMERKSRDNNMNVGNVNNGDDDGGHDNELIHYRKDVPLVWIGGVPRSGTTLMRAMLDAHAEVRCGEETRVIPRLLGMHAGMMRSDVEMTRLKEARIDETVLNNALGAYILSIISQHGDAAQRLCNKDPFTLRSMSRLRTIFPNSKFILMLRDGRATVHSIISRKVTIKGFDIKTYKGALTDWNRAISAMYEECEKAGPKWCLSVHYEQLVLHPEAQMKRILRFLELPWDDNVLHHENMIGGQVSLSKRELSTDQVNKPVNIGALSKWVDHIPADVRAEIRAIAPMLEQLGYDPDAYPPNYGTPDRLVLENSQRLNHTNNEPPHNRRFPWDS